MKQKISDHSENCSKSELDYFYVPSTQTAIEGFKYVKINPESGWDNDDFIQFEIKGSKSYFIDIGATEIYVELECKGYNNATSGSIDSLTYSKLDGTNTVTGNVYPVNNILHSLFKKCEISIENEINEKTDNYYAYRAYIEDLLNHDEEYKKTTLGMQGFYKDDANQFELYEETKQPTIASTTTKTSGTPETYATITTLTTHESNSGANIRRLLLNNKTNVFKGKLHGDIFSLNKLLLNGLGCSITLHKSSPEFFFMSKDKDAKANFKIKKIFLNVKQVNVNDSLALQIETTLNKKNSAQYPITRVLMKAIAISNTHDILNYSIHKGILPKRVILGFVKTQAIKGNILYNPYLFSNISLSKVELKVAGNSIPYQGGLDLKTSYISAYNLLNQYGPCGLTYADFIGGNFLLAFDLTPDQCIGEHFNPITDGELTVDLELNKATANDTYTMLAYLEYDALMLVDSNRQVSFTI